MELIWTAFALGLIGSLHCAGMCGPLALAIPAVGSSPAAFTAGRVVYNLGRLVTYCCIGFMFGAVGKSLALAGLQQWLSLLAGIAILVGFIFSTRYGATVPLFRGVIRLKAVFGRLLRDRSLAAQFSLGAINGLLPCGLVYIAAAAAVATGSFVGGITYMAAFGAGTMPMMLGIGLAQRRLQLTFRFRLQRLIPVSVVLVALLLIVRGMNLGIPYLSPQIAAADHPQASCH